ncbi:glucan biosynthesis protein [Methylobacterium gnaphalii]|uniref:Glucans biosynthesis protein G n=1 Tax=Methylobacterium gnaphalii TaxID=1010610 RepID=A0A512JNA5_9HYPH|nr:glucan biosynthesis protein D [Methylobacterium gnaphalii]GEP11447.1 glucans biosynthesis protein G [Methylobacterium gnaphalii]GJD70221.1 Glucans biosynthesis protein G [Methylobacterium gnaphalii]GLS50542.1 glucans biosynthesis protein G [Methylobacterium gnaphalii]
MTHPSAGLSEHEPYERVGADAGHSRRDVLRTAAGLVAGAMAGVGPALAQQTPPAMPAAGTPFAASTVPDLARALARQPYIAQRADGLPDVLKNLTREQYAGIRTAPGAAVWGDAGLDFAVEPLHRGSVYTDRVQLFLIEDGVVRPVPYARDRFAADGIALPDPGQTDPGFSGFRLRARFGGGELTDFASFQGVSFFRVIARGQGFGLTARALMLRPADARGEDFSRWRAFFIERPGKDGAPLVLHALLDAESCSAALRMTLKPGDASVVEVEGSIFTRAAIDHLGLGGAQTSYLFGPVGRRGVDDARAAAYSSGGLQIRNGSGEAIWRPVNNPQALQISSFVDDGPDGFGLMQRTRDYAAFQDDVQHWEWRPSLWIEPLEAEGGDGNAIWGPGAVTLLEIPSDSEVNENVIAYWRPRAVIPANGEARFRYRQTWCWQAPDPSPDQPALAVVGNSRSGRGSSAARRLFLVDFTGDILFAGQDGAVPELRTLLIASPGTITRQAIYPYPERRTVRVVFELDAGGQPASELRLALKAGERQVSETWLYRWTG